MNWTGVLPAITTPFTADGEVDLDFMCQHARWMIEAGCSGIVALGSLGEGGTLSLTEKRAVLSALVQALPDHPVVAGVAALSTREAVQIAQLAAACGCQGLMVLPPYAYSSDSREMNAHVSAVMQATALSCLLYNNPIAYRTDFLPAQIADLARQHRNLHAVKESSADIRRIAAIRHALDADTTLQILVGVDDLIVEGIAAGATGWIAGLVNAFPLESVRLFELASAGRHAQADALYRWFLPLLVLDTVPKFVQLIKLVQKTVGHGTEAVRAPRQVLEGAEREAALAVIQAALSNRAAALA